MTLAELTDEQREVRDLARRFADEVVAPQAAAWDAERRFPREVLTQLGELGLMGVSVPEGLGGVGAGHLTYALVLEELSRADAGLGVTLAVHTGAGTLPIVAHGTEDQRLRLVPPLAQGHELAAFALTESESGSDAARDAHDRRRAGPPDGHEAVDHERHLRPRLHGLRPRRAGRRRPSAFVVRRGAAGFRAVREEEKLGLHSSSTADLAFEGTPGELLGARGAGMRIALATLDGGRIGIAAQAVGIAQAALDVATGLRQGAAHVRRADRRATRPSSRSSPTCRPRSRRPAR